MVIAFCIDIEEFNNNRIFDQKWAAKFHGTYWLYLLKETLDKKFINIVTGDVALSNVQSKFWNPRDVYIISELKSKYAVKLIEYGANPLLLTCGESPIYAYEFYDQVDHFVSLFKNAMLFNNLKYKSNNIEHFYFPTYNISKELKSNSYSTKKNIVLVASNKDWKKSFPFKFYVNPIKFRRELINFFKRITSKSFNSATKNSLHDKRYQLIADILKNNIEFDLYGPLWNNRKKYTNKWINRIYKKIDSIYKGTVDSKSEIISQYKFAICFENISENGYITEKIIDCFISGTIPIYMGAPDINNYIPANLYINYSKFLNNEELFIYLDNIDENAYNEIIKEQKSFLSSGNGIKFSHQKMADNVSKLISSYEK